MGELAALLSAFMWSGTSLVLTALGARVSPAVLSALRLTAGSVVLVVLLLAMGRTDEYEGAGLSTFAGLVGSGLLGW